MKSNFNFISSKGITNFLKFILDFFIPRSNLKSSSIHSYLTEEEINNLTGKFLQLSAEFSKVLNSVFVCSSYKSDLIHDLIYRCKFNGELAIIDSLVNLIDTKTTDLIKPDVLTFVPADPIRNLERGYHLPQKIVTKLSQKKSVPVAEFVFKNKSTKPQTKLDKEHRLQNLKGVFSINPETLVEYKEDFDGVIWLVDDIITTMTTTLSVAKIIKKQYPKSTIIAVAVAG